MSGRWIKNNYGGEYYQQSREEEEEEEKIVTSKKIIDWMCNSSGRFDDQVDNCPFLKNVCQYSVIEKVFQLIKFREKIKSDRVKHIYHNGELANFVEGYSGINYRAGYSNSRYFYFSEFLDLFYKEYPGAIGFEMNTKINTHEEKLKSIEQFQAQILDKLTVFAEMLDEIQKGPIKVINYKQPDIILPVNPPDYEAVSLDS